MKKLKTKFNLFEALVCSFNNRNRSCINDHFLYSVSYLCIQLRGIGPNSLIFISGLHLVLCSIALNDTEGAKSAFHAMLEVEPPTFHQDITIDDVSAVLYF